MKPAVVHLRSTIGMYGAEQMLLGLCQQQSKQRWEPTIAAFAHRDHGRPELLDAASSAGLNWLAQLVPSPWLAGDRQTQADITTVVMYDFTRIVNAKLIPDGRFPRLDDLAQRCNAMPAFRDTRPVNEIDQANPTLPT